MQYNIVLKTEKNFRYIVEANNMEDAIRRAKDAASWNDFSNPECFYPIEENCREATKEDVDSIRDENILDAIDDEFEDEEEKM